MTSETRIRTLNTSILRWYNTLYDFIGIHKNDFEIISSEIFPGTTLSMLRNIYESMMPYLEAMIIDVSPFKQILTVLA